MSATTGIEWTDSTWNPIRGCSRVSEGCRNCYAETIAARFSDEGQPYHGLAVRTPSGQRWTGEVRLVEEHLTDPLRWRKPRRVFVNSMSDLFHENVPDEWIDRIFAVMALAPQHAFQVLTKRPERMREYLATMTFGQSLISEPSAYKRVVAAMDMPDWLPAARRFLRVPEAWPLPNVWLGASVEDQPRYYERIGKLLRTPAAVRFLSCEPLLGPVDLRMVGMSLPDYAPLDPLPKLDWVIVGGESGAGARPCRVAWIRDLVAQCRSAAVPVFIKQLGSNPEGDAQPPEQRDPVTGARTLTVMQQIEVRDRKGGRLSEWPDDLRVREFPRGVEVWA